MINKNKPELNWSLLISEQVLAKLAFEVAAEKCVKCNLPCTMLVRNMITLWESFEHEKNEEKETLIECDCQIKRLVYVKTK